MAEDKSKTLTPAGSSAAGCSAASYATKSQIAAASARTAAEWIDREMWVEAYIELHAAAQICWERRNEERQQPNVKVSEGSGQ